MIDRMFAVFDVKMKLFLQPFLGRNVASALRQFGDMCNNPNAPFNKHPEDFVLYEIGGFDVEKGSLLPASAIHVVGKALDFVETKVVAESASN